LQSKKLISLIREACEDKQGQDTVVLDLRRFSTIANYFVITSGNSDRHVRAVADHVEEKLSAHRERCIHDEGYEDGCWILLDYGDVVVHIFRGDIRGFYNLERLWGNAPRIESAIIP